MMPRKKKADAAQDDGPVIVESQDLPDSLSGGMAVRYRETGQTGTLAGSVMGSGYLLVRWDKQHAGQGPYMKAPKSAWELA
jgi:hypothetical protein